MEMTKQIHRILRCRKCYRTGTAVWETSDKGVASLLELSEGFHRRARIPLSLPPQIVCDCGMEQPE